MTDNREEKWDEMKLEYQNKHMSERQVEEMKRMISKAKMENKRVRRTQIWKCLAGAAAVIAVTITVLPNTSSDIAYAMSRIPVLSKWVEVVTLRDYEYDDGRHSADISIPELTITLPTEQSERADSDIDVTYANPDGSQSSSQAGNENSDIQISLKKSSGEINAEIKEISMKLIAEFKEGLKQEEGYQTMEVKSEVVTTTDAYFTLKLICFQAAGSGYEENHFYTIDLNTGERIWLKDLFAEGSDYITVISENIKKQMKEQMAADDSVIYNLNSDIPDWDFETITDETSFYLNENEEIVICFNEGEVAPMYMGCVEFVIPNEIVADMRGK